MYIYRRAFVRLTIFSALVMGTIFISQPATAAALSCGPQCPAECQDEFQSCIATCGEDTQCIARCASAFNNCSSFCIC
jgi:hypothetical protein